MLTTPLSSRGALSASVSELCSSYEFGRLLNVESSLFLSYFSYPFVTETDPRNASCRIALCESKVPVLGIYFAYAGARFCSR